MKQDNSTNLLSYKSLARAAECLKALAHPRRLQIVQLLLDGELYTVMEIKQKLQDKVVCQQQLDRLHNNMRKLKNGWSRG